MKEFCKIILLFIEQTFIYFLFFILQQNVYCIYKERNVNELINIIGNDELYYNLLNLEGIILHSLEKDELKLPLLKPEGEASLNMSKFKVVRIINNNKEDNYILPTPKCNAEDIVKFEYITREQLIASYDSKYSDLIKRKNLIVKSLKIIKYMLVPMDFYRQTNNMKESLIALDNLFFQNSSRHSESLIYQTRYKMWLLKMKKLIHKNIKKKLFTNMPIHSESDALESDDLFFTTNSDINSMKKLNRVSDFYNMGIFNLIGSHFIVLGHFLVLRLALKHYHKYFELGSVKFYSWQNILQFNMSDRFKVLDLICDGSGNYEANMKRRKQYLKSKRTSLLEECEVLEFLIHHINKYQMELYTNANQLNLNMQVLLENIHVKKKFFEFMCNNEENCNIYESEKFKSEFTKISTEDDTNEFLESIYSEPKGLDAFNIYIHFHHFIKYYSYYNKNNILYVHLLNLIGILNGESKAYVSSIYLPGYYNIIQLSFDEKHDLTKLYENLLECVETCHLGSKYRSLVYSTDLILNVRNYDSQICNMCEGTLFYINGQTQDGITMLQKFYSYVTEVLQINNISSLIKDMNIYEDYANFLMHDAEWFTFLLLFRLVSYEGVARKGIVHAMYTSLKDEDKFNRTVLTSYWYPSPLKKYYSIYIRKKKSVNLLEKLENLLSSHTIEKMKKCIKFYIHVNSFLQLDFFYYLNESPLKQQHPFGLTMLIEQKFKTWFFDYLTGYSFINYEEESTRVEMAEKMQRGEFVLPKYSKWTSHLKKIIEASYEVYFEQRHIKNLFKYFKTYNINNKIMLMRDSYELYLENYKDILFTADIIDLKRNFSFYTDKKRRKLRSFYYIHSFWGNSMNYHKFGLVYGYTVNKNYLKEIVDELYPLYMVNKNIFSDMSFIQTVYLLFRKIESSFHSHRRNDDISINNIFFFNVRKDYYKLNRKDREEEINSSMASRFFSKTLFSVFQMLFTIKLSNDIDKLDRLYGSSEMIGLTVDEEPYLKFAYAYYGSMMDNLINTFLPLYIKKPITQLKYGKTFILANMYKLCSDIFTLLNLNNLSLLCEYQAVSSSNYYSYKKMAQFIDRKYTGIVIGAFIMKLWDVRMEALGQRVNNYFDKFMWPNILYPLGLLSVFFAGNILFRNVLYFPRTLPGELAEQVKHSLPETPKEKPSVFYIDVQVNVAVFHSLCTSMFLFALMRWYAFYDNVVFLIRSYIRLFDRFYSVLENYIALFIRGQVNKITTDALLKAFQRAYIATLNEGLYQEAITARITSKQLSKKESDKNNRDDIQIFDTQDIGILSGNCDFMYIDSPSSFEDLEESEKFLNEKKSTCYEKD
ncbi:cytoadherence linked asexual protein, putative [Plasmodium gallinaceum]|uniref:Cytoadherence linked asexual protein, putative n=1 Tax=Plasmodium gallinaceum TaxID=5849 RepID=A0A1J1GXG4_PLAGA|nr:cytoadherence linked asexual protein, putative [Plasmodium gallinaceum]CRG97175.1 cytoadherence linked asexual protein, putative [Plasmodium gallinaceum]